MSTQRTVLSSVKNVMQNSEGALLFLSVVAALFFAIQQVDGFGPTLFWNHQPERWETAGFIAAVVALGFAFHQRRLRIPSSFLAIATGLLLYFHNCCGWYVMTRSPIQPVLRFPPKPFWVDPSFTVLVGLAAAALLVSLWRHKHDPNAAF